MKTANFILFTIIHLLYLCNTGLNGDYCVDIDRYNPSTTRESSYRGHVTIKNNILYEIHWPNGGHSDADDFGYPEFGQDNIVSFSDNRGIQYKVTILKKGSDCFEGLPPLVQCSGTTLKGKRCRNKTGNESGICWLHR